MARVKQQSELHDVSTEELQNQLLLLRRQQRRLEARESMLAFGHLMMPDATDPNDADKTEYQISAPAKCLCGLVEDIEAGTKKRVAVSMPPQHGKTVNLSIFGAAWIIGRNPRARIVIATYNETRAKELGKDLLTLLQSPVYQQVFPDFAFDPMAKNQLYMQNTKGGRIMLAGAGGTITGKTADYFFIDDPIKGEDDESDLTPTALDRLWKWFFKVAFSRGSTKTRILVTHTRWAEDDLIGRLCDPNHPERNKTYAGIADKWFYMNLPAVITDAGLAEVLELKLERPKSVDVLDMFGDKPMTALWPENKSLEFFAEWKRGEPQSFSALAMGSPAPEEGIYFLNEYIVTYEYGQLPPLKELSVYGASDHAVSTKQNRDFTIIGCVGVDENDNIWVLPDLVYDRMQTDRTVEEIIACMKRNKPHVWWMESELISKSFGPFLLKRMQEERVYHAVDPIRPAGDKKVRARAIQGRMAMKKVFFPSYAPWWQDAKAQLLRFPTASHDDFVDWLAYIGMGMLKEISGNVPIKNNEKEPVTGSIEWILSQSLAKAQGKINHYKKEGW